MVTLLHTADWHLGRILHGVHLTEDQRFTLIEGLVPLAAARRPDAILIAGDVYDRAVPPADAVALLDEVLGRLVIDLGIPTVVIAGNHDSPDRLAFGSRLLRDRGLHVYGHAVTDAQPVLLGDADGEVAIHALPYLEPAEVRERLGDACLVGHGAATRAMVERIRARFTTVRNVLVGHAFVAGGAISDSERPLSVGGAGAVEAACFDGFDYVALGHLHRPQQVGGRPVHYAGSLLPYSLSEIDHEKSVQWIEMDSDGICRTERVQLPVRRRLRRVEGLLDDLLRGDPGEGRDDYVVVRLLDPGPKLDAMGRLRAIWPHVLHIERSGASPATTSRAAAVDRRGLDDGELFGRFFTDVCGEAMSAAEAAVLTTALGSWQREERARGDGAKTATPKTAKPKTTTPKTTTPKTASTKTATPKTASDPTEAPR